METLFIQVPELDSESEALNGIFYADCSSKDPESAMKRFIDSDAVVGSVSYSM